MPRLLVDEIDFRLVYLDTDQGNQFVLERREDDDAMGQPRWSVVQVRSTRILESLFRYILKKALEAEHAASQ